MKFQSKPVTIEAEQFFANKPLPFRDRGPYVGFDNGRFYVTTAHAQTVDLVDGDWVILEPVRWIILEPVAPNVQSFAAYPCKPDIFARRYEPAA